jgi:hypothetical protein
MVRLEDMSEADIRWNIERLRNEAKATLKHADSLEEYGETIVLNGEVQNEQK